VPEGDTIYRAARTLNRALAASLITRFESEFPALNRVADDRPIVGRTIESVSPRGKHLLFALSGGLVLRTHMRMHGSWHIYRHGERWHRPRCELRILLETDRFVAAGFSIPVAEFIAERELPRHRELAALGPDPLSAAFDPHEVVARMRPRRGAIAELLLDQRVIAGIGNVLKAEALFVAGVDPFAATSSLSDDVLERVVATARRLMAVNTLDDARVGGAARGRRTTGSMNPAAKLWVYDRAGRPCRRCGTPIAVGKTGADARATYWCPVCQPRQT